MRTKLFAIAVLGLIAGGTALAFTLTGKTAQADTQTVAAPVQADEAAGCCVTGDCCCPGQGACCDPAAKAKATATTTKSVKAGAGCCTTGDCCCPGQGSCCAATATPSAKAEVKACCAAKTEKAGGCCEK